MKIKQLSLLVFLSILSTFSFAEESWYQVEIVVFERLNPALDGERWHAADVIARANTIDLIPEEEAGDTRVPFSVLPAAKHRLSGTNRTFKLSGSYRPLIHYSWQQPALDRRSAKFVKVQKLDESSQEVIQSTETDSVDIEGEPAFIEDMVQQNKIIDGSIRVRSGFYLHVDVDLTYFSSLPEQFRIMPAAETVLETEQGVMQESIERFPVQLKSSRKVKLNEIHYFDHPMFGLIIQVSRL